MSSIFLPIRKQLEFLEKEITKAEKDFSKNKKENLVIINRRGYTEWYIQSNGKKIYLPKKEVKLARTLIQASYAKSFLRVAEWLRSEMQHLLEAEAERSASVMYHALADVYERLPDTRIALVDPYVLPDNEYMKAWEATPYEKKGFLPDAPEIFSERGEQVRSKSEKMAADKLLLLGVPYRFEYAWNIRGMGKIHPDFSILDIRERTMIIYEHFGMMNDPEYVRSALWKIDHYERAGFRLGHEFLCTFEAGDYVFDMKHFERMIRNRLQLS